MNYYPFHIGDYACKTRHLSWDEDAAYRRLLDACYTNEKPLPTDIRVVCRLAMATTDSQREAIRVVLEEFFDLTDAGWVNGRVEKELVEMRSKQQSQRDKANKRWKKASELPAGDIVNASVDAAVDDSAMPGDEPADAAASDFNAAASGLGAAAMPPTPTPTPTPTPIKPKDPPTASLSVPPSDAGSEKPPRPSKRCPDDFAPSQQLIDAMLLEAPDIDVERELAKFRDHTFRVGRTDWAATFRNWLRESVDRSKPSGGSFLDAKKAEGAKWFKDTSFDLSSTANRDSFDAQLAIR